MMRIDLNLVTEEAFKRVPGWWPRAYLTLLLFKFFEPSNYVAQAYSLRERAEAAGIGKTTLYKGLETLIKEELVKKEGSLYVLTPEGFRLLSILDAFKKGVKDSASDMEVINRLKDETLSRLMTLIKERESIMGKESEFVKNAIKYVEAYVEIIKMLTTEALRISEVKRIDEKLRSRGN
jgi:hypothetical protein